MKKTAKTSKKPQRKAQTQLTWVMIGSGTWGLWVGQIDASKRAIGEVIRTKAIFVHGCRNVRYWYGPTGGITSLAAKGPNPLDKRNRIGCRVDMTVTDVKNLYYLTQEAVANFEKVDPCPSV